MKNKNTILTLIPHRKQNHSNIYQIKYSKNPNYQLKKFEHPTKFSPNSQKIHTNLHSKPQLFSFSKKITFL